MLKIYHVPFTRGFRVMWACEELGIPYELERVSFVPEFRLSPEWLKKNPVGKVPVLEDGDLRMFESGAMLEYVLDRYGNGRLQPERGTAEHALMMQWCWFAEATFARPIGEMVNHGRAFPDGQIQAVIDEMRGRGEFSLSAVDQALADREFINGDSFSAADIMIGYAVMLVDRVMKSPTPNNAARWWTAMQARDGFKAARAAEEKMESEFQAGS